MLTVINYSLTLIFNRNIKFAAMTTHVTIITALFVVRTSFTSHDYFEYIRVKLKILQHMLLPYKISNNYLFYMPEEYLVIKIFNSPDISCRNRVVCKPILQFSNFMIDDHPTIFPFIIVNFIEVSGGINEGALLMHTADYSFIMELDLI